MGMKFIGSLHFRLLNGSKKWYPTPSCNWCDTPFWDQKGHMKWLIDNIEGKIYWPEHNDYWSNHNEDRNHGSWYRTLWFQKEEDKVLYQLRWEDLDFDG